MTNSQVAAGPAANGVAPTAGPVRPAPTSRLALQPLPPAADRIGGGLWAQRQRTNREVSIPQGAQRLAAAGNYDNLRLAAGHGEGPYHGPLFLDSDVYKWLEAVAWESARGSTPQLAEWHQHAVGLLAAAQQPDGYLNSYVQAHHQARFADLPFGHELYCAGHLFQAAVASHRATGDESLLQIAVRFADCLVDAFGPGRIESVGGHPEVETALVELYRETGRADYLTLAGFLVDTRGHQTLRNDQRDVSYFQDRVPVRSATTVEGHAVRALYLAAGVTDVYAETADRSLLTALQRQWTDMVATKTYLTGGVGSRWEGEAFGDAYELPPDLAYCETCAAIASVQWSWRMLLVTGEAGYADLIERTLYNAVLPGISLAGDAYFYVNALQLRTDAVRDDGRSPAHGRRPWFQTACCPPNIMRTLSALDHYVATGDTAGLQLHQYAPGVVEAGGLRVRVETDYPWAGAIELRVLAAPDEPRTLALRVPAWAVGSTVDGESVPAGDYARLERRWTGGDRVRLELPMAPRRTVADPRVDAVRGSVAIERGPLVYCFEQVDQPAGVGLDEVALAPGALTETARPDLLDGVTVVHAPARRLAQPAGGLPYHPEPESDDGPTAAGTAASEPLTLTAVPYFAWANRTVGAMRVWLPRVGLR